MVFSSVEFGFVAGLGGGFFVAFAFAGELGVGCSVPGFAEGGVGLLGGVIGGAVVVLGRGGARGGVWRLGGHSWGWGGPGRAGGMEGCSGLFYESKMVIEVGVRVEIWGRLGGEG